MTALEQSSASDHQKWRPRRTKKNQFPVRDTQLIVAFNGIIFTA